MPIDRTSRKRLGFTAVGTASGHGEGVEELLANRP
jgi:hypothetical protein